MDPLLKANRLNETVPYSNNSTLNDNKNTSKRKKFITMNASGVGFNANVNTLGAVKEYRYNTDYSDEDLLDSLHSDSLGKYERILALQTIKLYRSDAKVITRFILGNLSLGMLAHIPGLALFLAIFYYKEQQPFVVHLIHSLQIHTFSLFIYALAILLYYFFNTSIFTWVTFIASAAYLFFSLRQVYPKSIFSTFWRYTSIEILYYNYWVITIAVGIIISFLLF